MHLFAFQTIFIFIFFSKNAILWDKTPTRVEWEGLRCYRGTIVGMTSLIRSLLDVYDIEYESLFTEDEDGDDNDFPEYDEDSKKRVSISVSISVSVSRIVRSRFSSSRTMSSIDGRSSGLSRQHRRAKYKNFSTHSEGEEPILSSMMEETMPS